MLFINTHRTSACLPGPAPTMNSSGTMSVAVRWVCVAAALCLLLALPSPALAQSCSTNLTVNGVTRNFQICAVLPELSATIAWNLLSNGTLEVCFTAVAAGADNVWVAWGVNPSVVSSEQDFMPGAGVIITRVFQGAVSVGAFDLFDQNPSLPLTPPATTQHVAVLAKDGEFEGTTGKVYAQIVWAPTSVFHGWNSGSLDSSGKALEHSALQVLGKGFIDLSSGAVTAGKVSHRQLYFNHAILAVVGWGIFIPLGIMIARYARPFQAADPAWFYSHIVFQVSGFVLGLAAWILGRKLGDEAAYTSSTHASLGTVIFVFSILQVLAFVLRPGKEYKIRPYWNLYHHSVGYGALILAVVNIFIGFHLLQQNRLPKTGYRNAYIAVLCILAAIALILEVGTWIMYLKKRSRVPTVKMGQNGEDGTRNSYPSAYP